MWSCLMFYRVVCGYFGARMSEMRFVEWLVRMLGAVFLLMLADGRLLNYGADTGFG